jgi:hypothetical protein
MGTLPYLRCTISLAVERQWINVYKMLIASMLIFTAQFFITYIENENNEVTFPLSGNF